MHDRLAADAEQRLVEELRGTARGHALADGAGAQRHLLEDGAAAADLLADQARVGGEYRVIDERALELLRSERDRAERGRQLVRRAGGHRRERGEPLLARG